ncbi:MAG: hypothetical protein Q9227_001643 [Pyrenula ochraceoflavens]
MLSALFSVGALLSSTVHAIPLSETTLYPRQSSLVDCLNQAQVPIKSSTDSDYSTYSEDFNLRLTYKPAAITLPTTTDQVSAAVNCAVSNNVKVQARSGGHGYGSYALGGQDGSLVVDLENFNAINVDSSTNVATVGGGVRLGNLALGIYQQGGRALPHGTCPGVGIGGHFLHGGYGHDSRHWGLALDTIVGLDVVLANGSSVHATSTQYPDVYNAMRGAGDMFGIATTFYLQTQAAPSQLVNFLISIPAALNDVETATSAFMKLQDFALNSDLVDNNLSFGIYTTGTDFSITGWYFGDLSHFQSEIQPAMLNGFPAPASADVSSKDWTDSLLFIEGGSPPGPLQEPTTGYNQHAVFYAKSLVAQNSNPLSEDAVRSYWTYVTGPGRSQPAGSWFSIINLYGGRDSKINSPPDNTAAYSDRDALWVFQNYASAPDVGTYSQSQTDFIAGLNTAITNVQTDGNFGAYLNYQDPLLTPQQASDLYYGADLAAKLATYKKELDPKCVFWNPQAICPSS